MEEPAAEGDAVGLVVELLGVEIVEVLELGGFQNFGVERRHAVDAEAIVDVDVRHVHKAVVVQDVDPRIVELLLDPLVQRLDDGHDARRHSLEKGLGPLLQRFCQDGVVGVGAGLADLVDGVVQGKPPRREQADELRDNHGGVGVVDLHHGVLVELM